MRWLCPPSVEFDVSRDRLVEPPWWPAIGGMCTFCVAHPRLHRARRTRFQCCFYCCWAFFDTGLPSSFTRCIPSCGWLLLNWQALPVAGSHGLVANFPFTEGPGEAMMNRGSYSGETRHPGRETVILLLVLVRWWCAVAVFVCGDQGIVLALLRRSTVCWRSGATSSVEGVRSVRCFLWLLYGGTAGCVHAGSQDVCEPTCTRPVTYFC